eukprot:9773340-Alexandrium_andersonii.AAC.1
MGALPARFASDKPSITIGDHLPILGLHPPLLKRCAASSPRLAPSLLGTCCSFFKFHRNYGGKQRTDGAGGVRFFLIGSA